MLEQLIRAPYQYYLVDPLAKRINYSPLYLTYLGGLIGVLTLPALAYQHNLLAILFLLCSGYLDTLDGTVARHTHQTSDLGSVLDILMDRIVEFAVVLGLWCVAPENRSLLCLLMLGSILLCVTSFLIVSMFTPNDSNKSFYYSPGLIERAEAFIFFILMMLIPAYFTFLSLLFCALVLLTTLIRVSEFSNRSHSSVH